MPFWTEIRCLSSICLCLSALFILLWVGSAEWFRRSREVLMELSPTTVALVGLISKIEYHPWTTLVLLSFLRLLVGFLPICHGVRRIDTPAYRPCRTASHRAVLSRPGGTTGARPTCHRHHAIGQDYVRTAYTSAPFLDDTTYQTAPSVSQRMSCDRSYHRRSRKPTDPGSDAFPVY